MSKYGICPECEKKGEIVSLEKFKQTITANNGKKTKISGAFCPKCNFRTS